MGLWWWIYALVSEVILICLEVLWWEPAQRQFVSMLPHMALQVSSTLPTTSPAEYTQHAHCQKKYMIFELRNSCAYTA